MFIKSHFFNKKFYNRIIFDRKIFPNHCSCLCPKLILFGFPLQSQMSFGESPHWGFCPIGVKTLKTAKALSHSLSFREWALALYRVKRATAPCGALALTRVITPSSPSRVPVRKGALFANAPLIRGGHRASIGARAFLETAGALFANAPLIRGGHRTPIASGSIRKEAIALPTVRTLLGERDAQCGEYRKTISEKDKGRNRVFLKLVDSGMALKKEKFIKKTILKSSENYQNVQSSHVFWNYTFDKSRLKNYVSWFLHQFGEYKTIELLELLKSLGFEYATKAGISLGIDDLKIPPKKASLVSEAENYTKITVHQYQRGEITGVERFQRLIETWHRTSEVLKQEVISYFEETDILNPVYMMAFSGARGNISQVRQLVGMRGLMADPQGQLIEFPIRSNFREGLTLTEYIISSYGARKGIVDTALRTANAGYLTRRLVDVAQHVMISHYDCRTQRGIFLNDMKEGKKIIYSLQTRLIGRVLAKNIYQFSSKSTVKKTEMNVIAERNQEISAELAFNIVKIYNKVFVRSPLTCETKNLVCQLCYGWSLAQGNLVSIGEVVGVIAAQSIGEPGTQLTMRTFHTGGVFSGDVSDQIRAPYNGFIYYESLIPGTLIRNPEGKICFLTKSEGFVFFTKTKKFQQDQKQNEIKKFKIPSYTILFARNGEKVIEKQVIAQMSGLSRQQNIRDDAELTIKAELEGQFYSQILDFTEKYVGPRLDKEERLQIQQGTQYDFSSFIDKRDQQVEAWNWGYSWILSGKIYKLPIASFIFPNKGDFVSKNSIITQIQWYMPFASFQYTTIENSAISGFGKHKHIQSSSIKLVQNKLKLATINPLNYDSKRFTNSLVLSKINPIRNQFFKEKDLSASRFGLLPFLLQKPLEKVDWPFFTHLDFRPGSTQPPVVTSSKEQALEKVSSSSSALLGNSFDLVDRAKSFKKALAPRSVRKEAFKTLVRVLTPSMAGSGHRAPTGVRGGFAFPFGTLSLMRGALAKRAPFHSRREKDTIEGEEGVTVHSNKNSLIHLGQGQYKKRIQAQNIKFNLQQLVFSINLSKIKYKNFGYFLSISLKSNNDIYKKKYITSQNMIFMPTGIFHEKTSSSSYEISKNKNDVASKLLFNPMSKNLTKGSHFKINNNFESGSNNKNLYFPSIGTGMKRKKTKIVNQRQDIIVQIYPSNKNLEKSGLIFEKTDHFINQSILTKLNKPVHFFQKSKMENRLGKIGFSCSDCLSNSFKNYLLNPYWGPYQGSMATLVKGKSPVKVKSLKKKKLEKNGKSPYSENKKNFLFNILLLNLPTRSSIFTPTGAAKGGNKGGSMAAPGHRGAVREKKKERISRPRHERGISKDFLPVKEKDGTAFIYFKNYKFLLRKSLSNDRFFSNKFIKAKKNENQKSKEIVKNCNNDLMKSVFNFERIIKPISKPTCAEKEQIKKDLPSLPLFPYGTRLYSTVLKRKAKPFIEDKDLTSSSQSPVVPYQERAFAPSMDPLGKFLSHPRRGREWKGGSMATPYQGKSSFPAESYQRSGISNGKTKPPQTLLRATAPIRGNAVLTPTGTKSLSLPLLPFPIGIPMGVRSTIAPIGQVSEGMAKPAFRAPTDHLHNINLHPPIWSKIILSFIKNPYYRLNSNSKLNKVVKNTLERLNKENIFYITSKSIYKFWKPLKKIETLKAKKLSQTELKSISTKLINLQGLGRNFENCKFIYSIKLKKSINSFYKTSFKASKYSSSILYPVDINATPNISLLKQKPINENIINTKKVSKSVDFSIILKRKKRDKKGYNSDRKFSDFEDFSQFMGLISFPYQGKSSFVTKKSKQKVGLKREKQDTYFVKNKQLFMSPPSSLSRTELLPYKRKGSHASYSLPYPSLTRQSRRGWDRERALAPCFLRKGVRKWEGDGTAKPLRNLVKATAPSMVSVKKGALFANAPLIRGLAIPNGKAFSLRIHRTPVVPSTKKGMGSCPDRGKTLERITNQHAKEDEALIKGIRPKLQKAKTHSFQPTFSKVSFALLKKNQIFNNHLNLNLMLSKNHYKIIKFYLNYKEKYWNKTEKGKKKNQSVLKSFNFKFNNESYKNRNFENFDSPNESKEKKKKSVSFDLRSHFSFSFDKKKINLLYIEKNPLLFWLKKITTNLINSFLIKKKIIYKIKQNSKITGFFKGLKNQINYYDYFILKKFLFFIQNNFFTSKHYYLDQPSWSPSMMSVRKEGGHRAPIGAHTLGKARVSFHSRREKDPSPFGNRGEINLPLRGQGIQGLFQYKTFICTISTGWVYKSLKNQKVFTNNIVFPGKKIFSNFLFVKTNNSQLLDQSKRKKKYLPINQLNAIPYKIKRERIKVRASALKTFNRVLTVSSSLSGSLPLVGQEPIPFLLLRSLPLSGQEPYLIAKVEEGGLLPQKGKGTRKQNEGTTGAVAPSPPIGARALLGTTGAIAPIRGGVPNANARPPRTPVGVRTLRRVKRDRNEQERNFYNSDERGLKEKLALSKKNDDLVFDSHTVYVQSLHKKFMQNLETSLRFLKNLGRTKKLIWIKNQKTRFKPIFHLTEYTLQQCVVSNRQKNSLTHNFNVSLGKYYKNFEKKKNLSLYNSYKARVPIRDEIAKVEGAIPLKRAKTTLDFLKYSRVKKLIKPFSSKSKKKNSLSKKVNKIFQNIFLIKKVFEYKKLESIDYKKKLINEKNNWDFYRSLVLKSGDSFILPKSKRTIISNSSVTQQFLQNLGASLSYQIKTPKNSIINEVMSNVFNFFYLKEIKLNFFKNYPKFSQINNAFLLKNAYTRNFLFNKQKITLNILSKNANKDFSIFSNSIFQSIFNTSMSLQSIENSKNFIFPKPSYVNNLKKSLANPTQNVIVNNLLCKSEFNQRTTQLKLGLGAKTRINKIWFYKASPIEFINLNVSIINTLYSNKSPKSFLNFSKSIYPSKLFFNKKTIIFPFLLNFYKKVLCNQYNTRLEGQLKSYSADRLSSKESEKVFRVLFKKVFEQPFFGYFLSTKMQMITKNTSNLSGYSLSFFSCPFQDLSSSFPFRRWKAQKLKKTEKPHVENRKDLIYWGKNLKEGVHKQKLLNGTGPAKVGGSMAAPYQGCVSKKSPFTYRHMATPPRGGLPFFQQKPIPSPGGLLSQKGIGKGTRKQSQGTTGVLNASFLPDPSPFLTERGARAFINQITQKDTKDKKLLHRFKLIQHIRLQKQNKTKSQTQFFIVSNQKMLISRPLAKTSFLSPFNGEIVKVKYSNRFHKNLLFSDIAKDFENLKKKKQNKDSKNCLVKNTTQAKSCLVLTKKDCISFYSLPLLSTEINLDSKEVMHKADSIEKQFLFSKISPYSILEEKFDSFLNTTDISVERTFSYSSKLIFKSIQLKVEIAKKSRTFYKFEKLPPKSKLSYNNSLLKQKSLKGVHNKIVNVGDFVVPGQTNEVAHNDYSQENKEFKYLSSREKGFKKSGQVIHIGLSKKLYQFFNCLFIIKTDPSIIKTPFKIVDFSYIQKNLFILRTKKQPTDLCPINYSFYSNVFNLIPLFSNKKIISSNSWVLTIRKAQPLFISQKGVFHVSDGDFVQKRSSIITLAYQRLKTGDIVQGIPKVEQFFEARTTKRGRLFLDSLPNLLRGLFFYYKKGYHLNSKKQSLIIKNKDKEQNNQNFSKINLIVFAKNKKENLQKSLPFVTKEVIPLKTPVVSSFHKERKTVRTQTKVRLPLPSHSRSALAPKGERDAGQGVLTLGKARAPSMLSVRKGGGHRAPFLTERGVTLTNSKLTFDKSKKIIDITNEKDLNSFIIKPTFKDAVRQSIYKIQQIIVDGVQRVYQAQGVTIADKHLEIIVKQMTSRVKIAQGGQTGFFPGETVNLDFVECVNSRMRRGPAHYEPQVLGITRASLQVESFISAASFQQTTRILSSAALSKKKDFLKGLKENVILGNLIPAGTGYYNKFFIGPVPSLRKERAL